MKNTHKINGKIYITNGEVAKKGEFGMISDGVDYKVILTNDDNLKQVQQLTAQEVELIESGVEFEVEKEKYSERFDNPNNILIEGIFNPENWCNRYKLIPKHQLIPNPQSFDQYLQKLKDRRTEDNYRYTDEDFDKHLDYINECYNNERSIYKCLEFMSFAGKDKELSLEGWERSWEIINKQFENEKLANRD